MIKRGALTINLSAATAHNYIADAGTDTLTDLATGELIEFRRKSHIYNDRDRYLSGSWALEHTPDKAIGLNGRFEPSTFILAQDNRIFPANRSPREDSLIQGNDEPG